MGTQVLLDASRTYGVKRYHQVSTDEVYGSLGAEGYFTEQTPLCPHSPYSASKTSADMVVMAYHDTYKMPVTITRCSNNYGPYHFPEKLIPLIIKNILEGKNLPVYGDGSNVRDWLYVEDHCKAIDLVVREGVEGEVYNVGSGRAHSVREILDRLLAMASCPVPVVQDPARLRPSDTRVICCDHSKLTLHTGWAPQIPLDAILSDVLCEWRENVQKGLEVCCKN